VLAKREECLAGRSVYTKTGTTSGHPEAFGVPTLIDRLIQQALHQVLQPLFEPTFSESSFGFRPGRGPHQAVRQAQGYIRAGKRWVVDIDLEKFFDRVNHDVLTARVARQVSDARVLKRRELAFCRYADDCNIYVGSQAAGHRVMKGVRTFLEEALKLQINGEKSAVALGYSVTAHRENRVRIARKAYNG
jgi:RNA-directed DNA polymerase